MSASSQQTVIAVVKSLLSFLHRNGIIRTNPGGEIKPSNAKDTLNERILTEAEV